MREASAILLVREFPDGYRTSLAVRNRDATIYPDLLECPCGKLEPGEYEEDAAIRELEEEAGIRIDETRLNAVGVIVCRDQDDKPVKLFLYIVEVLATEEPDYTEPDKRSPWVWLKLAEQYGAHLTPATAVLVRVAQCNYRD